MDLFLHFTLFCAYFINIGPQHPSTHGVLRLITFLHGEIIQWIIPEMGFLSRASDKLIEFHSYNASIPYFDRLDYVSTISQEGLFIASLERFLQCLVSSYTASVRTLFFEVSRILNHLLAITTHGIDIGALNPMLWAFEEREQLLNFQEAISGARMHTTFLSITNIRFDIPIRLLYDVYDWTLHFPTKLKEIHTLLTHNRIWVDRLHEIGIINRDMCIRAGYSGVISRASGNTVDGRLASYEYYNSLKWNMILGSKGDCLDRYLIRINESFESSQIILQCLHRIPYHTSAVIEVKVENMQSMISNFNSSQLWWTFSLGYRLYQESPKGLYSIYLLPFYEVQEGLDRPLRVDFTTQDYLIISTLNKYSRNIYLADLIAILGSVDFVLGSIDLFFFYILFGPPLKCNNSKIS